MRFVEEVVDIFREYRLRVRGTLVNILIIGCSDSWSRRWGNIWIIYQSVIRSMSQWRGHSKSQRRFQCNIWII